MRYLLGLDLGTTHVKALLFDETGRTAGEARAPSPLTLLEAGGGIFDAEALWQICCQLLQRLAGAHEACGTGGVSGIAVTGMGEAGVPMDGDGRVLYPVIAWFDPRTEGCPDWWGRTFGSERLFEITNLKNRHIFTANKLLWLKEQEPAVFKRMKRWNCLPDFIACRLTGRSAMDYSIASRTMLLDVRTKAWSEEVLAHGGIPRDILPELVPPGTKIGEVTPAAAAQCGLKAGTPVFAGGHDHICGALAAGVVAPGVALDSSGTCEEVLVSVDSMQDTRSLSRAGFHAGFHVAPGKCYTAGGIPASGASVDWFKRTLFPASGGSGGSRPGANGLLFLPHLRGSSSPQRDQMSKGALAGIQPHHTWGDFMQAVYEGVAFELRLTMEALSGGSCPKRVVAIGGGTMDSRWLQIKADVLGVKIEVPAVRECTALGAALLAGIGAGVYKDAGEAVEKTFRLGKTAVPQQETKALYDRLYAVYRTLGNALYPVNQDLERQRQGG
ncbi:MAG: hypothetical protein HFG00_03225 [Oscillibacter sp.]|nr:hypothetical protein [Oscillibacter sp.]